MGWSSLLNVDGRIDWDVFVFEVGINLLITLIAYLLVPTVLVLLGKKYELKKLKRINLINCIIVWLTFRILEIALNNNPSTGAAIFLWGSIGYWILKKYCLAPKQPDFTSSSTSTQYTPYVCLSAEDEVPLAHKYGLIHGSDIKLEKNTETPKFSVPVPNVRQASSYVPNTKPTAKYCSHCGHAIDSVTKKCSGCGKQYFKGFATKTVLIITLYILLLISLVGIILLHTSNIKLREKTDILSTANDTLQTDITTTNMASSLLQEKTMEQVEKLEKKHDSSVYRGTTWQNEQIDDKVDDARSKETEQNAASKTLKDGQIGVFIYTIDHEFTADYVYARCKSSIIDAKDLGIDPEVIIYDIMDEYGGEFHIIESGDFVDEIDSWCFSSERKVGDLEIIENPYGYAVCYISCIGE